MHSLTAKTAIVVGASRGLGLYIAQAFSTSGASVIAVARDASMLRELAATSPSIQPETADATDSASADRLLQLCSWSGARLGAAPATRAKTSGA